MISRSRPALLVLCILDGWGERTKTDDNAIAAAGWDDVAARTDPAGIRTSSESLTVCAPTW